MSKFVVNVTQTVVVELDESKFDEAFMAEFREGFYPFFTTTDHAEHIAQLIARGLIDITWRQNDFIEGYGAAHEMGITASVTETEIESAPGAASGERGMG